MMENTTRTAIDVTAVWGVPLTAVHCDNCKEAHLVPEGEIPPRCPFCLQGPVEPQPAYLREEPPEMMVPHQLLVPKLTQALDRWARGIWFRPSDLKASTLAQRARRYFIPLWLVDGRIAAAWRADVGFDYQVVSHQDRYREGAGWRSQEVKETRVRWEPRVGRLDRTYENVSAPALDDHRALMTRLGNYNLITRAAYDPRGVTNAVVRIPSLEPDAAWPGVEAAFTRTAEGECQEAAGADHIRGFTLQATYDNLNWTLLLLPAYVTWYQEGERIWPVLVNGQSGRVSGVRRGSARKANVTSLALGGVALILFLLGGILALLGAIAPPAAVVGGLILLFGVLLAVFAPIPAIGVWVSNRRSAGDS
jgi:hypothetical protein